MNRYAELGTAFEKRVVDYVRELSKGKPEELYEPNSYMLSLGGKRLRPLLCLAACELFGTDPVAAMDAALAVELFHNFSLIHDDILDEAPLRRGQSTVHQKYGKNVAILSGDVMLVNALQALASYEDETFKRLSLLLQKTAVQVCEGQQDDMNFERLDYVSEDAYIRMISGKTAVLLGCSLQMGAICAGATALQREQVHEFGLHLGIAFQLLDDLLDAFPPANAGFGKKRGGDIVAGKKTYLHIHAMAKASPPERRKLESLFSANRDSQEKIDEVLSIYSALGSDKACRQEADRHTGIAIGVLSSIECDPLKRAELGAFASDLLSRVQ